MKNSKSVIVFVIAMVVILGGIFLKNSKEQSPDAISLEPVEKVEFEATTDGSFVVRDNDEFVAWASDLLGAYGDNQNEIDAILHSAAFENFLEPASYESTVEIIEGLDHLIVLMDSQKEEIVALDARIAKLATSGESYDDTQLSYVQELLYGLNPESVNTIHITTYDLLKQGFEKAREHYIAMNESGYISLDNMDAEVRAVQQQLLQEVKDSFGGKNIMVPVVATIYPSWAQLKDTDRVIQLTTLSDEDRSLLELQESDTIFDTGSIVNAVILESAQKCLNQIPFDQFGSTYAQIFGIQSNNTKYAYVALISEQTLGEYGIGTETLADTVVDIPDASISKFQNIYVNLLDFSCSPVQQAE